MVVHQLKKEPELIQAIFCRDKTAVEALLDRDDQLGRVLDAEKRMPIHAAAYMGDAEIVKLLITKGKARVDIKDNLWLSPLHRACAVKAHEVVEVLLEAKADVNARDKSWRTAFHVAAANNACECVDLILPRLANINISDRAGRTSLHHACNAGHSQMVELLLQNGLNANAQDKRETRPLHWAALKGNDKIVELLLAAGAEIDARDKDHLTALHVSAAAGNLSVVSILLEMGASITDRNLHGNTAVHTAALNGHVDVLEELVAAGHNWPTGYSSPRHSWTIGFDINCTNYKGQTVLHLAAVATQSEACLHLLLAEEGAHVNARSADGRTALHMAAIHGRISRVEALLSYKAEITAVDTSGHTPLHIAAFHGHELLVNKLLADQVLLDPVAEVNRRDKLGRTSLHLSAISGHVDTCKKLIQIGAQIDALDHTGKSALHMAAFKGSIACLDYLISSGADFTILDKDCRSALHYSAANAHFHCVETLVATGSHVDHQDGEGLTALHVASWHDQEGSCVEYLLAHKATPSLTDDKGMNALHYAAVAGNSSAIQHILHYGGSELFGTSNPPPEDASTSLHLAAYHGQSDALLVLLSKFRNVEVEDGRGRSPLYLASHQGCTECVSILMEQGAHVTTHNKADGKTAVHAAAAQGHEETLKKLLDNTEEASVIDSRDANGMQPLMLASHAGHVACVKLLLEYGCNVKGVDPQGRSALLWALAANQEAAAEVLIEHSGRDLLGSDRLGKNATHIAAGCGQINVLFALLELQSSLATLPDSVGFTPVHYAAFHGQEGSLELLLERTKRAKELIGADVSELHCAVVMDHQHCTNLLINHWGVQQINSRTTTEMTPLHVAAANNSTVSARILLDKGADPNAIDSKGRTPIMLATKFGHLSSLKVLLEYSASLDISDLNGNTVLHYACAKGFSKSANFLLKHVGESADLLSRQNVDGKTALHVAAGRGMVETTEMLLTAGASVTICDSQGNPPALACARDEDTATCLAMILSVYLANPSIDTRKSLCSIGSIRRSEIMSRLSLYLGDLDLDHSPDTKSLDGVVKRSSENGYPGNHTINGHPEKSSSGNNSRYSSDTEYF